MKDFITKIYLYLNRDFIGYSIIQRYYYKLHNGSYDHYMEDLNSRLNYLKGYSYKGETLVEKHMRHKEIKYIKRILKGDDKIIDNNPFVGMIRDIMYKKLDKDPGLRNKETYEEMIKELKEKLG